MPASSSYARNKNKKPVQSSVLRDSVRELRNVLPGVL